MEETDAVARLRQGDLHGLEVLVARYQTPALRLAYLVTLDLPMAEDVVQEAFLRAAARIGQFDQRRPFGPWFLRNVVNAARTTAQRQRRQASLDQLTAATPAGEGHLAAATGDEPAQRFERLETHEEVRAALVCLTPAQRALIVQRYYLELSEAEIAGAQATPLGTVKWRLHTARRRLRAVLTVAGLVPPPPSDQEQ